MNARAGWYQDPNNAAQQRYWTGEQWSEHVQAVDVVRRPTGAVGVKREKSVATGVILTVLFGPFGFFYLGAGYGFAALGIALVAILIGVFTFGVSIVVYWVGLIIWIVRAVKAHNSELNTQVVRTASPPAPPLPASPQQSAPMIQASPGAGSSANEMWVHVVGAVNNPGLYQIPRGSRVHDAIQAAGGASAIADLSALNMARQIVDGEQISVP